MENRGSEWRKWNCHVHTKGTNKNDQFTSGTLDEFFYVFFKKAYEKNVQAIGITDYFSIDRYRDALKYVSEIEHKKREVTQESLFTEPEISFIKSIFLFPNVELRITPTNKKGKFINLHFIFDPKIVNELENEFFNKLSNVENFLMNFDSICRYAKSINPSLHVDQLYKFGIDNYNVEFGKIKTLLETNKLIKENSLIAISSKSNDGVSGLKDYYEEFENEGGSLLGTIKSIYRLSPVIFSNAPSDKEYFLGKKTSPKEVINHAGSLKPCIVGCDSHTEDTLFNRHTWIKSDLTFEGLKQITFEPEERVKVQDEIPEAEKLDTLMIEKVKFISSENKFTPNEIFFNKNLNVIIGGKSSGKSILLYEIAKTLYSDINDKVLKYTDTEDNQEKDLYSLNSDDSNYDFSVVLYTKSQQLKRDRQTQASILPSVKYIPQNHLSNLVDKSRKNGATLKKLIRGLILEEPEYQLKYNDFVAQVQRNDDQRNQDIDYYYSLKNELEKREDGLLKRGDTKALSEGIIFNKKKIDELSKDFKTEESIEYHELIGKRNQLTIQENQISSDFDKLDIYKSDLKHFLVEFSNKKRILLDSLQNTSIKAYYSDKLQFVDDALASINEIGLHLSKDESGFIGNSLFAIETSSIITQKEIIEAKLKPFTDRLENQKQIAALEKSINEDEAKIAEIEQLHKEIETTRREISSQKEKIFRDFGENFKLYEKIINDLKPRIASIQGEADKIEILPTIKYNFPRFRQLADRLFDGRGFNNQGFDYLYQYGGGSPKSALADIEYDQIEKSLRELFEKIETKRLLPKGGNTESDAIKKIFTDLFFDHWDVMSQGDDIHKMSTGKASFVLLKLMIKLSKENGPILIDQPEDNLDNRSVSLELVDFLKDKKRERQIILVTHNPNIVVNADAENIIVANQNGQSDIESTSEYKFDYINGALENSFAKNGHTDLLKSMGIREHIAEIVEGGKDAFKKREEKYGFGKNVV